MIILLYWFIKQKEKKKDNMCSKVLMCTFLSKLQKCPYTIVYIFQILFCVCCMYSPWHTVMNKYIQILLYSVLFYYTIHVSGIK